MKHPRPREGKGAFLMSFTDTLGSNVNATKAPSKAIGNGTRFRWCPLSNSIERIRIIKGEVQA